MFDKLTQRSGYWIMMLVIGLAMEGIALFYQYGLDYGPCVLCIHIRIFVAALILLSLLALLLHGSRSGRLFSNFGTFLISAGMLERSWKTLGIEQGWIESACNMDLGLPGWFAVDSWFPAVFEAWEACGYTPELLFGITMAQGLVAMSASLLVISLLTTLGTLARQPERKMFAGL